MTPFDLNQVWKIVFTETCSMRVFIASNTEQNWDNSCFSYWSDET